MADLVGNPEDWFSRVAAQSLSCDTGSLASITEPRNEKMYNIRKTCPCNTCIYPLKPHFYIVKLGYADVYLFFLFLLQNIDCRLLVRTASMFWAKTYDKKKKKF